MSSALISSRTFWRTGLDAAKSTLYPQTLSATARPKRGSLVSSVMAEPPASTWDIRGRGAGFTSLVTVPSGALLLLEELDWEPVWADAEMQRALRKKDAARHRVPAAV